MITEAVLSGASSGISSTVSSLIEKIGGAIIDSSKLNFDKTRIAFQTGFEKYLEQTRLRCSKVKTLIHRHDPVSIESAYVPVDLKSRQSALNAVDLVGIGDDFKHATISGIAGSGKSMTLKYTYIQACSVNYGYIPIFVELRNVNFEKQSLVSFISEVLEPFIGSIHKKALDFGLQRGDFFLLFDGFDEISRELRQKAEEEIVKISHDFPKCKILLTSRPDSRVESWPSFVNLEIQPLTLEQICSLIEKIDYADQSKENFISRVKSSLYETHSSLLSNPLLATMMLLTFDEYAEIPSKMHIFYRQAFEVLYSRHDRFKPQFVRQYVSGLQFDGLERHIATFAFTSQLDGVFAFAEKTALEYAQKAIHYEGSAVKPDALVSDMADNLCLLIKDGDKFSFIHRSFQEYFCSCFLANGNIPNFRKYVDRFVESHLGDRVVTMLYEMNPELLEKVYLMPKLKLFAAALAKLKNDDFAKAKIITSSLNCTSVGGFSIGYTVSSTGGYLPKWGALTVILGRMFPEVSLHRLESMNEIKAKLQEKSSRKSERITIRFESLEPSEFRKLKLDVWIREYQKKIEELLKKISKKSETRASILSDSLVRR